jgi:hypothetical protein
MMKAGIFFTGSGAVLILTSHDSLSDPDLIEKLLAKGIDKYIAFEVPIDMVQNRYGTHYKTVMNDLKQEDDLRVMDFDGRRIFQRFSFKEMGDPTYHEA